MNQKTFTLFIIAFITIVGLMSCKKNNIAANGNEVISTDSVLYKAVLQGGEQGDQSRGDVSIEKIASKKYLVFKNFISNGGPDVHVYLSKTIGSNAMPATDYIDLGLLRYTSGTFNYELTNNPDIDTYKYALVWCAQYRIQFGYGELTR